MQHAPALHIELVDFVGRFQRRIEEAQESRRRNRAFRRTFKMLSRLSDHELKDIGISRDQIERVAYQSSMAI